MRSYYYRLLNYNKTKIVIALIFLIPMIDILLNYNDYSGMILPYLGTFLSGSSQGHIPQILLVWFLPVFMLIMCGDSYLDDYKTGYRYIMGTKKGRSNYYQKTLLGNMLLSFVAVVISLLVNMLLAFILFNNGDFDLGLTIDILPENSLYTFALTYPYLTNVIYIIVFGLFASLCTGCSTVICWIFPNKTYAYPLSFIVWFLHIIGLGTSLPMIVQPFNEVYFDEYIKTFSFTVLFFICVIFIGFVYKVRTDEV
jgi:hypothetical protein